MYISAPTLDDLLMRVLKKLLASKNRVKPTRGDMTELTGVLLKIKNPRARLSRTETKGKIFSCLGELLWYLSGTNDVAFIAYYIPKYKEDSEDGVTVYGGYGPRIRGKIDQITNVLNLLKQNPNSRRAVIQLFDAKDIMNRHRKEIPCTCTLQFMIRKNRLHMLTNMRSNDAFLGLPHDVFAFTMLQELMARSLNVELGAYKHAVGSLHLYDEHTKDAQRYLSEGWQESIPMPAMPLGDPWSSVQVLLKYESNIRRGKGSHNSDLKLDGYWADLLRLLQIHWHGKRDEGEAIARIKRNMSSSIFNSYIQRRQKVKQGKQTLEQLSLPAL